MTKTCFSSLFSFVNLTLLVGQ